jgi:hypothetical protein
MMRSSAVPPGKCRFSASNGPVRHATDSHCRQSLCAQLGQSLSAVPVCSARPVFLTAGPRGVLLQFVILVVPAFFMYTYFVVGML